MKRLLRITLVLALVVGLLAAGGWGVWYALGQNPAAGFRTATAERGDLVATISATGTIEPEEVIDIGAQVAAQVKNFGTDPRDPKKSIDYGTPVHPGTLLAQLDDALYKARVEQTAASVEEAASQIKQAEVNIERAEADLLQLQAKFNQAERDHARAKQLRLSRSIADADYDAAQAAIETAKANVKVGESAINQAKAALTQAQKAKGRSEAMLREAEVNLGYTQIRSPVEGVIVDRRVNVGQTVVAGLNAPSLFLLAKDLKRLQVWASVNEADIGSIHSGQTVRFTVDAYPKATFTGQVAQIRLNASMTQNVVTYTVVVSTDNSDGKLLPYMTANLQFEVDRRPDALLVPNAALRWRPQVGQIVPEERANFTKTGKQRAGAAKGGAEKEAHDRAVVWVADGEFVRPLPVRIGMSDGAQTEILEGTLDSGDAVVIGTARVSNGDSTSNPFTPKMFSGGKKS
jgi:HlyD family secretion protein